MAKKASSGRPKKPSSGRRKLRQVVKRKPIQRGRRNVE